MDPAVVLPLLLAALVALVLALFLRRASGVLRATRRVERFQEDAAALGAHLDALLEATITQVDAMRRGATDGAAIGGALASAAESLDQAMAQAAALEAPPALLPAREAIVADIAHAGRALDMVRHGCALAAGPRARSRSMEAQISVKRGYLNLLHAREALARHVADLAEARDVAQAAWRTFRA
jgi:hypothetical protein